MNDHRCARPGCHVEVAGYMLACLSHWRELPLPIRSAVLRTWWRRRRRPTDDDAVTAHLSAVLRAMDWWLGVRVDNPAEFLA